jgi:D-3-phosphoglycerate dehydrogenase
MFMILLWRLSLVIRLILVIVVAQLAKGFGMDVLAFDPFVPADKIVSEGVTPITDLKELYRRSNYLSLHIPANEQTKKSINYDLLSVMPKGACLVNTARKEVIHEEDLMRVMEERPDFKYVSDIAPDSLAA